MLPLGYLFSLKFNFCLVFRNLMRWLLRNILYISFIIFCLNDGVPNSSIFELFDSNSLEKVRIYLYNCLLLIFLWQCNWCRNVSTCYCICCMRFQIFFSRWLLAITFCFVFYARNHRMNEFWVIFFARSHETNNHSNWYGYDWTENTVIHVRHVDKYFEKPPYGTAGIKKRFGISN